MSRSTTNRNLFIVLLVMAGAWVGVELFSGRKYEPDESVRAAESMFPDFNRDEVTTLKIEGPKTQSVELTRQGEQWTVTGNFRADQSAVDKVLTDLKDMKLGMPVSSKLDDLERYDLEGEEAIRVKALNAGGNVVAGFTLGKNSDSFRSFFLKREDEDAIRKVSGQIRANFDKTVSGSWRDQTIFDASVPSDSVTEVAVMKGDQLALEFRREKVMGPKEPAEGEPGDEAAPTEPEMEVKESVWNMTAPEEGRAVKYMVDNMARALTDLKCDSFSDGKKSLAELGLEPAAYRLVARFGEGEGDQHVLLLGNKTDDNKYPVKKPGEDTVWFVQGWRCDYFVKPAADLLEKKPTAGEDLTEEDLTDEMEAAAIDGDGGTAEEAEEGDDGAAAGTEGAEAAVPADGDGAQASVPADGDGAEVEAAEETEGGDGRP